MARAFQARGSETDMRHASIFLALAATLSVLGCAENEDYAPCPFDPCLYAQCTQQEGTAQGTEITYSCAVEHLQCDEGICLRYEGSGPFCTQSCDPANGNDDCPGIGTCFKYLGASADRPAVHYCLPPSEELPVDDPSEWGECNAQ